MSIRERTQSRPSGSVHGVLVVDKPQGLTSHDVVGRVRRIFGTRRVGHAGTLDPMATGVLVVLLGETTKLSSVLTTDKKSYEARVEFGTATSSLDAEGEVTKKVALTDTWLESAALESALQAERVRRLQIPPQVSAIKVEGQRAYARARKGQTTELPPRDVTVHELSLIDPEQVVPGATHLDLRLTVSKGYYVRSLANDLGAALGVPAHLSRLRRTRSGSFDIEVAAPFPPTQDSPLIPLASAARSALPSLQVTPLGAERLGQGKRLLPEDIEGEEPPPSALPIAAFAQNRLVALIEPADPGEYRVKRGINDPDWDDSSLAPEQP